MFPVRAYTFLGKILIWILGALLSFAHIFLGKYRQFAPHHFHDDPRRFNFKDVIYFAYKYYFNPPINDDADGKTAEFFKTHPPIFSDKIQLKEINSNTLPSQLTKQITLHAAGDLMPYSWIQTQFCEHLWDDIETDFLQCDISFANLETPVLLSQPPALVPEIMLTDMRFNANEAMCDIFFNTQSGKKPIFDVLSTANNHALDMDVDGVKSTIDFLKSKNIQHTGTSKTEKDVYDFPVIESNGISVAFIAFTYSINQYTNPENENWWVNHLEINQPNVDLTPIKKLVEHAYKIRAADFVVLSLHFSNAYQVYPNAHILENSKRIFSECGVDIILGGHAHNVQPSANINFYCPFTNRQKSGFIVFSMGDFIANDIFNWCKMPMYVKIILTKFKLVNENVCEIFDVKLIPVFVYSDYKNDNERDLRLLNVDRVEAFLKENTRYAKPNLKNFYAMTEFYKKFILNFI